MDKLEDEFREGFEAWKADPSRNNTGLMLRQLDPVISSAMRTYTAGQAGNPTLKSRARLLAAESLQSYDPTRGTLRSHMLSRLQRLRRYAAQSRQIIRMPEQVALDQTRTAEAAAELQERLGRPPSDSEIADHTGLSLRRLAHIRRGVRPVAEGTLVRPGMAEDTGNYDPEVESLAGPTATWLEFVYDDQDPTNQYIMERALGMHGHPQMSPGAIAQALKISPAAVSQRMRRIQQQIDEVEDLGAM